LQTLKRENLSGGTYIKIRENSIENERRAVLFNPFVRESFSFCLGGTVDIHGIASLGGAFPGDFDEFVVP
jgi:hypothetical protein